VSASSCLLLVLGAKGSSICIHNTTRLHQLLQLALDTVGALAWGLLLVLAGQPHRSSAGCCLWPADILEQVVQVLEQAMLLLQGAEDVVVLLLPQLVGGASSEPVRRATVR
jgi:hypothetical protein